MTGFTEVVTLSLSVLFIHSHRFTLKHIQAFIVNLFSLYIYIYCKFRLACEGVIGSKKEKKRNAAVVFQRFFPQQLLLTFSVLIPSHFSKSKSCSAQMKNS